MIWPRTMQQPSLELLESAMARLEREGHREGIQRLSQEVGTSNWRAFNALNKVELSIMKIRVLAT